MLLLLLFSFSGCTKRGSKLFGSCVEVNCILKWIYVNALGIRIFSNGKTSCSRLQKEPLYINYTTDTHYNIHKRHCKFIEEIYFCMTISEFTSQTVDIVWSNRRFSHFFVIFHFFAFMNDMRCVCVFPHWRAWRNASFFWMQAIWYVRTLTHVQKKHFTVYNNKSKRPKWKSFFKINYHHSQFHNEAIYSNAFYFIRLCIICTILLSYLLSFAFILHVRWMLKIRKRIKQFMCGQCYNGFVTAVEILNFSIFHTSCPHTYEQTHKWYYQNHTKESQSKCWQNQQINVTFCINSI